MSLTVAPEPPASPGYAPGGAPPADPKDSAGQGLGTPPAPGGAPPEAPTCGRCGAPLALDATAPQVTCRHCHASFAVDEGLRRRMSLYVAHTRRAQEGELVARRLAAFHSQGARASGLMLSGTLGVAVLGGLWAFLLPSGAASSLPFVVVGLLVALTLASMFALARGFEVTLACPSLERMIALRAAVCRSCGASIAFEEGAPVTACRHCASTALAPTTLAWSLLREAQGREDQARVAALQAEAHGVQAVRRVAAKVGVDPQTGSPNKLVAVLFLLVTAVVVACIPFIGRTGRTPVGWVSPALWLGVAGMIVWVALAIRRSLRDQDALEAKLGVPLRARTLAEAQARGAGVPHRS